MNASLQLFHLLLNDIRHSHGLAIRRNINIDIYRVQSIHPIIAVGVLVLHLHGSQIVQINHLSIYVFQRHLTQRFSKQLGGEMQGNLLLVSLRRGVHHRTDDFILPDIVANAIGYVIRRDAVCRKSHRVITYLHVCIRRASHFHLVNAIHCLQLPDHILLHKVLNQLGLYVGIHQVSQQQFLGIVRCHAADHLASHQRRIRNALRQSLVRLSQQGRNLEPDGGDIHILLQIDHDFTFAKIRLGRNTLHPFQRRHHSLYRRGEILLHHLCRHMRPLVLDGHALALSWCRLSPHVDEGSQRHANNHQDDESQYHTKRG